MSRRCILWSDTATSTNDLALGGDGAQPGSVWVTDHQTKGRGRRVGATQRVWFAPPGDSVLMSMRFEPKLTAQETPALTLAAAVGVARAVSEVCGLEVGLKWPNDLFIGGRKVGGILTEGRTSDDGRVVVVVGVGLNLNVEAGDFPDELASVATSLSAEAGRGFDRLSVVTAVADALSDVVELATQPQGLRPILEEWQARSVMDGRRVKTSPGGVEGVARGLSAEGGLLVETAAGEVEIKSGEVLWG